MPIYSVESGDNMSLLKWKLKKITGSKTSDDGVMFSVIWGHFFMGLVIVGVIPAILFWLDGVPITTLFLANIIISGLLSSMLSAITYIFYKITEN